MLIPALTADMTETKVSTNTMLRHDQPQLTTQHFEPTSSSGSFHHVRGSLPLKKRRYHDITSFHESAAASVVASITSSDPKHINSEPHSSGNTDKETIAALALVAAARASESGILSPQSDCQNSNALINEGIPIHGIGEPNGLLQNQNNRDFRASPSSHIQKPPFSALSSTPATNDKVIAHEFSPLTAGSIPSKPTQPRQRINHPPLTSPIPGGCHGRTSRNNSYCRRTPCYKNSKFCKLHYQQYVVQGGADPNCVDIVKLDKIGKRGISDPGNEMNGDGSGNLLSIGQRSHQDKRYTGNSKDEVQCLATTTRGRPCAYVAVHNTKYCHLHADYDTNPPPRRGGSSSTAQKIKQQPNDTLANGLTTLSSGNGLTKTFCTVTTLHGDNSRQQGIIPSSSSSKRVVYPLFKFPTSTLQTKSELAPGKEPSTTPPTIDPPPPFPLLNSIPSDKWSDKLVLISTGPLVNHVGRVLKWGNGWITVSTTTGGKSPQDSNEILHNRRAIELYLVPEELLGSTSTHHDADIASSENGSKTLLMDKDDENRKNDSMLPPSAHLKQSNNIPTIPAPFYQKPSSLMAINDEHLKHVPTQRNEVRLDMDVEENVEMVVNNQQLKIGATTPNGASISNKNHYEKVKSPHVGVATSDSQLKPTQSDLQHTPELLMSSETKDLIGNVMKIQDKTILAPLKSLSLTHPVSSTTQKSDPVISNVNVTKDAPSEFQKS